MFYSTDSTDSTTTTCDFTDFGESFTPLAKGYKGEELDLWFIESLREWREYLRVLWLDVLRAKQYLGIIRFSNCRLYYRRLLFSVSGWLARVGQNKKN